MRAPPPLRGGCLPLFVLADVPQGADWRQAGGVVFANTPPTPAQADGWRSVLEWGGGEQGTASHGAHCLCCVGRGGLDQFLLAQAQSRVRGMGDPLAVMVVVCDPALVRTYRTQLKASVFLSSFYDLQA